MPNKATLQAVFTPADARQLAALARLHAVPVYANVIDLDAERAARR